LQFSVVGGAFWPNAMDAIMSGSKIAL